MSDKVQFEYSNIESYLVWKDFVLMVVSDKVLTFICCLLVLTLGCFDKLFPHLMQPSIVMLSPALLAKNSRRLAIV